ncbi:MAG TPA: hypothetical protein PKK69_01255 [Ferruginibacter sp.]|nr:hypothetical protein [Ferruginibacter sp.]
MKFLYSPILLLVFLCEARMVKAQFTVSGTVFDQSKVNYVEQVRVVSSSGVFAFTDSMGRYHIPVRPDDSLYFYYNNRPTQKFAVSAIDDPQHFNIVLHIPVKSRYRLMEEVTVISKSYRQDSLENRQTYAAIYDFQSPRAASSISADGMSGLDLDQFINVFRFGYNKQRRALQKRLLEEEKEKFINNRFSKVFVRRITGIQGARLDSFMIWFRPDFAFTRDSDEITFNQYILQAAKQMNHIWPTDPAKKPEP